MGLRIGGSPSTTIYSATDSSGAHVAIEVLDPGLTRDAAVRKRFVEAGFLANAVGHPAIARVIEVGSIPDGAPCLVLDLDEGEGLEHFRRSAGGKLETGEVVDLFIQLLDVLAVAHERGIVHGEIGTSNLFLEVAGRLRVLDFGFTSEASLATKDARSDVRAAASTAFLLLTGHKPGADAATVLETFADTLPRIVLDVLALALGPIADARTETRALRALLVGVHPRSARRPVLAIVGPNEQTRQMSALDPALAAALLRDESSRALMPELPPSPESTLDVAEPFLVPDDAASPPAVAPSQVSAPAPAPVDTSVQYAHMLPSPEIPVAPFSVSELGVSRARGRLRIGVVVLVLLVLALCVLAALSSR